MSSNNLTTVVGISSQTPLKKTIFTSDVGVQTDTLIRGPDSSLGTTEDPMTEFNYEEEAFQLTSSDLAAILRWSKDISSDINLSSGMSFSWSVLDLMLISVALYSSAKAHRNRNGELWCSMCMCSNSS